MPVFAVKARAAVGGPGEASAPGGGAAGEAAPEGGCGDGAGGCCGDGEGCCAGAGTCAKASAAVSSATHASGTVRITPTVYKNATSGGLPLVAWGERRASPQKATV